MMNQYWWHRVAPERLEQNQDVERPVNRLTAIRLQKCTKKILLFWCFPRTMCGDFRSLLSIMTSSIWPDPQASRAWMPSHRLCFESMNLVASASRREGDVRLIQIFHGLFGLVLLMLWPVSGQNLLPLERPTA